MSIRSDRRMFEYYAKLTVYCPNCGHSNTIPVQLEKKICSWCGHTVYRTKEIEFKEKLIKAQKKEGKVL